MRADLLHRIAQINGTLPLMETTAWSLLKRQRAVNEYLAVLGRTYHDSIPIDDIFAVLETNGFRAVQEDGTPWAGILTGRDGRAVFDLFDIESQAPSRRTFVLIWHKMDVSHKYELTGYLS